MLGDGARLIDGRTGAQLTGDRLAGEIGAVADALGRVPAGTVLCLTGNDLPSTLRYLGVREAGRPALLWDAQATAATVTELVERFAPAAVLGLDAADADGRRPVARPAPPPGYVAAEPAALGAAWLRRDPPPATAHPELALLLGTSGSTGQPRLVRHSDAGVRASAHAIREALRIDAADVAITTLPLFYTYGLSVLHSHLAAGAAVVVEPRGLLSPGFWDSVTAHRVSTLAGVPHTYELLDRRPWQPVQHPAIRALTVSGGRLRDDLLLRLHAQLGERDGAMFVMYGQTEAGSRICVLPPAQLPAKLGSVGPPVPGMGLQIEPAEGAPDGCGEVVCHSVTVMMGYAEHAGDLARGDDLGGTLRTGDLGRLDADGYLWLAGRSSRIGKAFGIRINLDAVEHAAAALATVAATPGDDRVVVWCEGLPGERLPEMAALLARATGVHASGFRIGTVERIPRRPNGKVDYQALAD